jgi:hypothetical protein
MCQTPPVIAKKGNTSKAKPTMCVSSTNKGKTQIGWVVPIRQRTQRRANANNTPPKGPPYCVPNSDEMIMKSSYLEASKKYSGDGHA